MGKAFLKSYIGVCMEGAVVVLACLIFSAFASSGAPIVDTSLPVVTMSWQYVAQTIFNMLILVALIKGAERIAKEMFGPPFFSPYIQGWVRRCTAEIR